MKKNYTFSMVVLALVLCQLLSAQEAQKNFINYQGVARNTENQLMASEAMTVNIALKFGAAASPAMYEESHSLMTDANGVFSLQIGNGSAVSGEYDSLPWGSMASFITVSMNGNEIGTTELMAVPYAIRSGKADDQSAAEVLYDNAVSGLDAITAQDAIDELVTGGSVDADADPKNEFQTLSFNTSTNELSLSDGNSVTIPNGGTDADADPENELQTISFNATTNELSLTDGGTVTIPSGGTDADADPENELQTISFNATTNELSLTDGGTVTIPSGGTDADADPENELQNLSLTGTTLNITDGEGVDLAPIIPPGGTDNQNLILTGDVLSIENGSGSVDLSTYTGEDTDPTNEIDVTAEDGLLMGDGSNITGLVGTADGQVAKWDAGMNSWVAGADETGGGGSPWSERGDNVFRRSGNVGIGSGAPRAPLHIFSNQPETSLFQTSTIRNYTGFLNSNGFIGYAGIWSGENDMDFGTDGGNNLGKVHLTTRAVPKLTVAANGNVGIGTTNPTTKMHIESNSTTDNPQIRLEEEGNDYARIELTNTRTPNFWHVAGLPANNATNARLNFFFGNAGGGHNRMTIKGGGNVGIGTNDPTAKLDVVGSIHVRRNSAEAQPQIKLEETGNDYARLELTNDRTSSFWHVAGLPANNATNGRLNFYFSNASGGNNRMSITGDGKVGIDGVPRARLHIFQHGQEANSGLRISDGHNQDWEIIHRGGIWFVYDGNPRAGIHALTGAYMQASDRRLKTNIANLSPILDGVNQLRPVTYNFKSDSSKKNVLGLIAQEVEPLFPELVTTSGKDEMLALDYAGFSVVAIKAIQEQQQIIDKQSERISDLEERLTLLEAKL